METIDPCEASEGPNTQEGSGEHFLPRTLRYWAHHLRRAGWVSSEEEPSFLNLARILEAQYYFEAHALLRELRHIYEQLDPDLLGKNTLSLDAERIASLTGSFLTQFEKILQRANYRRLDREQIEAAAKAASDWGVYTQIDLDAFDHLLVYARGAGVFTRKRRRKFQPWKEEEVEVPHYERLVVAFSLKPGYRLNDAVRESAVYLKLFKEIPHSEVDSLLPCSAVRMSWFDRTRIALPTLSGVGFLLYKLYTLLLHGIAAVLSSAVSLLAFLGILGGTLGYGVRSFIGYLNTLNKYHLTLTRSLYYQNLDNNAGVLFRLLDEAAQQDLLETLLGYWFLWKVGEAGLDERELDRRVETFLAEAGAGGIDFEVDDALRKLRESGIAWMDGDQRWHARPLTEALEQLDQQWNASVEAHRQSPIPAPADPPGKPTT